MTTNPLPTYRTPSHHPVHHGFTLAEVVIAGLVLAVLMAGVWSMFQMQQRVMEQGQRLSRQSRVALSLRRAFQEDLKRTVLAARRSISASGDLPVAGGSGVLGSQGTDRPQVAVQFRFQGGPDWLLVDLYREGYQLSAFSPGALEDPAAGPGGAVGAGAGIMASIQDLPVTHPTPFERVLYIWLTDQEIQDVASIMWGRPQPESSEVFGATQSPGQRQGQEPGGPADPGPTAGTGLDPLTLALATPRTLVRIRCDWSWPREDEAMGQSWAEALGGDALGDGALTGVDDFLGSAVPSANRGNPTRQAWLRLLLSQNRSGYRQFQLASGRALDLESGQTDPLAADAGTGNQGEWSSASQRMDQDDAAASEILLPNQRQPQVDWFPEVPVGKFQYFDGRVWSENFAGSPELPRPIALRLEYQVQPNRAPVPLPLDPDRGLDQGLSPADGEIGMESWQPLPETLADLRDPRMGPRPLFDHVTVFTFTSQATTRDPAFELDEVDEADSLEYEDAEAWDDWNALGSNSRWGSTGSLGELP